MEAVYANGADKTFEPLFARCLIERIVADKIGSIIIPADKIKIMAATGGKLIACGATCEDSVKALVGKEILFAKFAGDWIKVNDKEIFIIQEEDILGVKHG